MAYIPDLSCFCVVQIALIGVTHGFQLQSILYVSLVSQAEAVALLGMMNWLQCRISLMWAMSYT